MNRRLKLLREKYFDSHNHFCSTAERNGFHISVRRYAAIEMGRTKPTAEEITVICSLLHIRKDSWLFTSDPKAVLRELRHQDKNFKPARQNAPAAPEPYLIAQVTKNLIKPGAAVYKSIAQLLHNRFKFQRDVA